MLSLENQCSYTIDFPEKGEYGINVYARYKDDPSRIYHVHTCMADYDSQIEESCVTIEEPAVVVVETWKDETTEK